MPPPPRDRVRKPLIVGEQNPYGGDDEFALYPAPDGCSGHRLCCLILGMRRAAYLAAFDRCNLVQGSWNLAVARVRAKELWERPTGRFILLGSKVCAAWEIPFKPFQVYDGGTTLILPHPSGINRMWNEDGVIERVRMIVRQFLPDVASLIGAADLRKDPAGEAGSEGESC